MANVASIAGHLAFLDALAAAWLSQAGGDPEAVGRGMILLPTRRAARALTEAFLRLAAGRVLLLPRILAAGGLGEAPLALAGALDLPPAVEPMQRLTVLARMILAAGNHFGVAPTADQAWLLARSLAELMDEAERAETDLAARLPHLAESHAEHWQKTLDFLRIVTEAWPLWLEEHGLMNPVARQNALLRVQADAWGSAPPSPAGEPVWAAGFTVASPALCSLLAAIARLPAGRLVLPGLDRSMDEADFASLPDSHAQSGLRHLLAAVGVTREAVADWTGASAVPSGRLRALQAVLLPEQALGDWLSATGPAHLAGVSRLDAADQQEEAAAIALVLRDALQTPGRRAALVTPDRGLAARVVVELTRFGVLVDDSAGEPLLATPPAIFLRLLAEACCGGLAPVALLALLKHPLAAAGRPGAECRRLARLLELACLRGPAPARGFDALRVALRRAEGDTHTRVPEPQALHGFLDDLQQRLAPLLELCRQSRAVPVPDLLDALMQAGEALAQTDALSGAEILWSLEEGNVLAGQLAALAQHAALLPPQGPRVLAGLLDAALAGVAVRSRRALRGRQAGAEHPRLFIWGLLEARLQSVELAVLGGLVEGVWPPSADPGPWMSRPMRMQAGLPSPEERIGESAHDFLSASCCAPELVLSRPGRRDGAPAVPARWLVRLDAWLQGRDQALEQHPALSWLRRIDQPEGAPRPVAPPRPCPPVALRPRRLSVTEIETWMRDPYAIHARHVLKLAALRPLEEAADAADYGTIVHEALSVFLRAYGAAWPADADLQLQRAFLQALDAAALRPALAAWWRPRLLRIAGWVAQTEADRRARQAPVRIASECDGRVALQALPGGDFELRGRADRIEVNPDGSLCLLDYKTGTLPTGPAVLEGWSSQLVLEAAMARLGAFGPELSGETSELAYWRLSGGHEPGREMRPVKAAADLQELVGRCWEALRGLINEYDNPSQPYLSQPRPGSVPRFTDYALLARVAEWSAAQEDGE
ncbi:double-strand break repair protein AddB [Lichenicoccus sp.]|uniref:double-strand break repair protein AddB n=1 Tax=Lichenicoccus sp. TaxID=2781899 RepID=UPI003D149291